MVKDFLLDGFFLILQSQHREYPFQKKYQPTKCIIKIYLYVVICSFKAFLYYSFRYGFSLKLWSCFF